MEVYVAVYDTEWRVDKLDTSEMRLLRSSVPQKSDVIWRNMIGHVNELFLTEKDAWEYIKEWRMDKRYYLDTDGSLKKYA